jgi:hypothetical protein
VNLGVSGGVTFAQDVGNVILFGPETAFAQPPIGVAPVPQANFAQGVFLETPEDVANASRFLGGNAILILVTLRPGGTVAEPVVTPAAETTALTRGVRLAIRIRRADFTPSELAAIEQRFIVANARIASGAEQATVGARVPFSSFRSRRFVRDTLFPGRPIRSVRTPRGLNVDEIVSRQFGGRQVPANQQLLIERVNQALGGLERAAAANLPQGTRIQGFVLVIE